MSLKFNPNQFIKKKSAVHNEEIFCDIYGVGTQNGENDFEKIFFSMKTVTLEVDKHSRAFEVQFVWDTLLFLKCNICRSDLNIKKNASIFFRFVLFSYNCQLWSVIKTAKILFFSSDLKNLYKWRTKGENMCLSFFYSGLAQKLEIL